MGIRSTSKVIVTGQPASGIINTNSITPIGFSDSAKLPTPLAWNPPSDSWLEFINVEKWWAKGYLTPEKIPADKAPLLALRDGLLKFGGNEVVLPGIEEDLKTIITRGQFWYGDGAKMVSGNSSQCHQNSIQRWERNPDELFIATGYALSVDGIFRQHTWLVDRKTDGIIETTEPRIGYFGFRMTDAEAQQFADDNF